MDNIHHSNIDLFIVRTVDLDGTESQQILQFPQSTETITQPTIDPRTEAGREAWRRLHTELQPTSEWFEQEWKPLIPQSCGCSASANKLLEQCPPRFESREEFFAWSVEYHNAVNRKLRKPEISLDEALAIWRP